MHRHSLLPLLLITAILTLSGCCSRHCDRAVHKPPFSDAPHKPVARVAAKPTSAKPATRSSSIKVYNNTEALLGQPFRDLGRIDGKQCQASAKQGAANLSIARQRMLRKAAELKANAVLLHQCHIVTNSEGCYRLAECQGSALSITTP